MKALLSNTYLKILGVGFFLLLLAYLSYASLVFGIVETSWHTAIDAFTQFNGTNEHIVIKEVRVPRVLNALAVGMCLGIAGTLLQALTRNPIADVELFGLNAGAAFFVVVAITFFGISSLTQFTWIAFLGSAVSGVVVYLLGSLGRDGMTPVKLTLAGAAITALAASARHGMMVLNEKSVDEVLFWLSGSVGGRKLEFLTAVFPYMIVAWIIAFLLARPIQTLLMGDDVAKGLGQRTMMVKLAAGATIVLLSGSSVAVAGPIGFVGLVTPHLARFLVGIETRWVMLYSGLLGAALLLAADIGARFVAKPAEVPIGVMTALIGIPFFIYVARKGLDKG
ncbi:MULTISPECIES: FecCD family ABC transporter permease [Brevibacillus]|jgi:iron complex transport system permease protein|uniref:ABC transporter permease n=1 Tax=Brevibacillus borstelensis AK1 TaxID=1300222 RepID=M8D9X1_9BACL|nr:iron ABC transporter permease [Brevibacillus borstelensis]EMT50158.1 ABC transporter permease [Brevibacillus borstelensis AK1]KKX53337.1 iron ABC transporter [Brevibacillus borstelensis cifa_chp40]MBE5394220.1 iron ABC transporter permease [Brevibacillus borstelensis]MCC0566142.1 iron ABC transporter permease [Brevibacillus borstelensis]MCM3472455.1 iron ABC transporter permease [Brevibacillus borstelensis]